MSDHGAATGATRGKRDPKSRTKIQISNDSSPGFQITLRIKCDPEEIGPERSAALYAGIAQIAGAVLEVEEIPELLRLFDAARKRIAARAGHKRMMPTRIDQPNHNTSLYQLEAQLLELIEFREAAESDEEKAAADEAIQLYVQAECKKVDNILVYLKHCEHMAKMAGAEVSRLASLERQWLRRHERLKEATLTAMVAFGVKKLEGELGSFKVTKNPPSVEVTDLGLLPMEYQTAHVTMPAVNWESIRERLEFSKLAEVLAGIETQFSPNKIAVGAELKRTEPCPACHGEAIVCLDCNSTGKVAGHVAGASLVNDKVRLEVR